PRLRPDGRPGGAGPAADGSRVGEEGGGVSGPLMPRRWPVAGLALLLAGGAAFAHRALSDPSFFPAIDFVEYWAAGRLNADGGDPYDPEQLGPLQRAASPRHAQKPIM